MGANGGLSNQISRYSTWPARICCAAAKGSVSSAHRISRWHIRAAVSSANSNRKNSLVLFKLLGSNPGGRLRQQALQRDAEIRAVQRIGQRELHETLEVAREVADVVSLFLGRELHGQHAAPFVAQKLDGVRQLAFLALIRLHAADHVENHRRENVSPGDGQVARRLL